MWSFSESFRYPFWEWSHDERSWVARWKFTCASPVQMEEELFLFTLVLDFRWKFTYPFPLNLENDFLLLSLFVFSFPVMWCFKEYFHYTFSEWSSAASWKLTCPSPMEMEGAFLPSFQIPDENSLLLSFGKWKTLFLFLPFSSPIMWSFTESFHYPFQKGHMMRDLE